MTTERIVTETLCVDGRTVVDSRSHRTESRFARPPRTGLARPSVSLHRSTLGLLGLGVALAAANVLVVREHHEANLLREALRDAQLHLREAESTIVEAALAGEHQGSNGSGLALPSGPLPNASRAGAERLAADLIAVNNYQAGLVQFESLANQFPGDRTYSDFVVALRWRVGCTGGGGTGATRCD